MPGLLFPTRLFMPAAERATAWPRRVAGPSLLRRQERGATDVRHHVLELALDLAVQRLLVGLLLRRRLRLQRQEEVGLLLLRGGVEKRALRMESIRQ
jgi:hypothetical protein